MRLSRLLQAVGFIAICGCSSSTEAGGNLTPDGLKISLTALPDPVNLGGAVVVSMHVENTTSDTIRRAFPLNNAGPVPTFDLAHLTGTFDPSGGFFGSFMEFNTADTLTVAPHETKTGVWTLLATAAGATTIVGCFPENNDGLLPHVCATRTVTIRAN